MLGWINVCIENLVIDKYGVDTWHIIKQKAGCEVQDGGFLKLEHYTDKSSVDLAIAASEMSGLTVDQVLEAVGEFWVPYVRREGYENLMSCQGGNLKDWLTNINAIHQHLQATFPNKMNMPQFWCEDSTDGSGALILHHFSSRGSLLAPVGKGIVAEQARSHFGVPINMDRIQTQGVDGASMTTWVITAQNPSEQWKLSCSQDQQDAIQDYSTRPLKCPFTGMSTLIPRNTSSHSLSKLNNDMSIIIEQCHEKCPSRKNSLVTTPTSSDTTACSENSSQSTASVQEQNEVGLSATVTKSLLPYHIIMNENFTILQVGQSLSRVLESSDEELVGNVISEVFEITKPMEIQWEWNWLRKLEDQTFILEPSLSSSEHLGLRFKTSIVLISNFPTQAMLIMAPDAGNLDELMEMNLTLSDLPVHGDYRDAVFLREHLSSQMNSALKMEKLSKSLAREKELLESLLPRHAAEGLRAGKTVEPMMHKHVTMFFSDIVGFTTICEKIYPWEIISMLNRLYCVMDYLAAKFNLFKV
jgi:guanylate cyclase soluble subunit beta